ncbi:MAG TPA: efflux RND transporter periplasmic adaptor subunit [Phycisphaerae bacterium]|nr:efflux RND transporter periplasmic adaptor subunit [Phycisphaerae bacterium]HRY67008.1 efflux RND transporter periplasmic adaptor subunit [Phycisphaerae bacterium]HSA28847.1 efflux RND transporter periplasmic adaptor subunit [Phycisphaerae bacterium]
MSQAPSEIRNQLQSLRIPKEQRPASAARYGRPRRRRGLRWLLLLVVLGGLGASGYHWRDRLEPVIARFTAGEAIEVRTLQVEVQRNIGPRPVLTATGKIVSDHKVQVATKVSGQIVGLYFEQGDNVKKGQVLARLEDVNPKAMRDQAAARLERAKANLTYQKFNFERMNGLFNQDTAPRIEYAEAKRALLDAEGAVAMEQAALDYAQKQLSDCEVVAPIAGVILERNVEVGDFVAAEGGRGANANAQFALIADMTKLRVEVDVSELDINRIHKDMPCKITPEAYKNREFGGRVLWIDPGANYSKATVQVKIRIEDPDPSILRVEGSAKVVFLPEHGTGDPAPGSQAAAASQGAPATQGTPTPWIPLSACIPEETGEKGIVFVISEGRAKRTIVTIGRRIGGQLEIVEGLTAGQTIVAEELNRLSDGQRIQP